MTLLLDYDVMLGFNPFNALACCIMSKLRTLAVILMFALVKEKARYVRYYHVFLGLLVHLMEPNL